MKHQIMLKIKHLSRCILEFKHIPNLENITVKINYFPNFQDFVQALNGNCRQETPQYNNSIDNLQLKTKQVTTTANNVMLVVTLLHLNKSTDSYYPAQQFHSVLNLLY